MGTQWIRTDLATELRTEHLKEFCKEKDEQINGIDYSEETVDSFYCNTIRVTNREGSEIIGKEIGTYVTVRSGAIWRSPSKDFYCCTELLAKKIKMLSSELGYHSGTVLVCGLGNREITPDSIGPNCARHIIVTSHLKKLNPRLYQDMEVGDVASLSPGVLGQTGMESAKLIEAAVNVIKPTLVIAVDALAAREIENLATTVQLCDTGVSPGSGVGNQRNEISYKTLGIPVICIGVPTVVDTATLVFDALDRSGLAEDSSTANAVLKSLQQDRYFVSPKEMDKIAEELSTLIAYAINRAFHPQMSFEEMARW